MKRRGVAEAGVRVVDDRRFVNDWLAYRHVRSARLAERLAADSW
jgi:hypothetical protein